MPILNRITKELHDGKQIKCYFERRSLILGGGALVVGLVFRPMISAAQDESFNGLHKINLAGRQRMLIQRAGKLICMAHLAPNSIPLLTAAEEALRVHQMTELALREGNSNLGLAEETNQRVLNALLRAEKAFLPYRTTIREAIEGRVVELRHVQILANLNNSALNAMDDAVKIIENVHQGDPMSNRLALLVNIAGRQRMFTQRLIFLLCLFHSTGSSKRLREAIVLTMNRFDISMNVLLRVSHSAIPNVSRKAITQGLTAAENDWSALKKQTYKEIEPASITSLETIVAMNEQAEGLLGTLDDIVLHYAGSTR